jgi:hypothetical protein
MHDASLEVHPRTRENGWTTLAATLSEAGGVRNRVWFRLPTQHEDAATDTADPFVVGLIFRVMTRCGSLHVHGQVSPTLLRGIEEFMAAWRAWRPQQYHVAHIEADLEREPPAQPELGLAALAFSGGLDSCFSLLRHRAGALGRRRRNVVAGVFVESQDARLDERCFEPRLQPSRRILDSVGATLIPISTNLREVQRLRDPDGLMSNFLASLILLQARFDTGLVASSDRYEHLILPNPTSPLTDPLLSTGRFSILHDGAECSRSEKAGFVARWPEILRDLWVCSQWPEADHNCGVCEKCIRTVLNFRVAGHGPPACFPADVTDRQIRSARLRSFGQYDEWESLLQCARERGLEKQSWVQQVERPLKRYRRRRRKRAWQAGWRRNWARLALTVRGEKRTGGSPSRRRAPTPSSTRR